MFKRLAAWQDGVVTLEDRHGPENYTFPEAILDTDATQEAVYAQAGERLVQSFCAPLGEAYNGLLFAYGQTGTGKTYVTVGRITVDRVTHTLVYWTLVLSLW